VPGWGGHLAGQHIDLKLTAQDGYSAQRSYSLSRPADGERIELTVQQIADGEVSPYLTGVRPARKSSFADPSAAGSFGDPPRPGFCWSLADRALCR
jgi:Flavodoxin reductases (ferredoxin-NADPH reductases) family 1